MFKKFTSICNLCEYLIISKCKCLVFQSFCMSFHCVVWLITTLGFESLMYVYNCYVVILIRYGIPSVLLLEIDLLPLRTDGDISHFIFTPLISWDGHLTDDQQSNLWETWINFYKVLGERMIINFSCNK